MSAENRVLALQLAIETVVPEGGGFPAGQGNDVTTVADLYYRWLEGPVVLLLTISALTFDQDAPDGPGVPTVMKGNAMAQITDLQQYTASVGEVDLIMFGRASRRGAGLGALRALRGGELAGSGARVLWVSTSSDATRHAAPLAMNALR